MVALDNRGRKYAHPHKIQSSNFNLFFQVAYKVAVKSLVAKPINKLPTNAIAVDDTF